MSDTNPICRCGHARSRHNLWNAETGVNGGKGFSCRNCDCVSFDLVSGSD